VEPSGLNRASNGMTLPLPLQGVSKMFGQTSEMRPLHHRKYYTSVCLQTPNFRTTTLTLPEITSLDFYLLGSLKTVVY